MITENLDIELYEEVFAVMKDFRKKHPDYLPEIEIKAKDIVELPKSIFALGVVGSVLQKKKDDDWLGNCASVLIAISIKTRQAKRMALIKNKSL